MNIKVVSWNIAGGHKIASLKNFDYQEEDIEYFSDQIKKFIPDIVCLQEVHTNPDKSNAEDLENLLGIKLLINSENSPSHIEDSFKLGNSVLSNLIPLNIEEAFLPDPEGDLFWSDGRKAVTHRKNLQYLEFEKFNLANNQMLPVSLFGFKYDDAEGRGKILTKEINEVMAKVVNKPIIWCGDFNYINPTNIYKHIQTLGLRDALPDNSTRPTLDGEKKKPDHILYSTEFKLIVSDIIQTETDHYLCYAQFELD